MCWCRVTLPHLTDFYNLMSFWTISPRNIFQSTGLLSIKVMLYIKKRKKKRTEPEHGELLNCGMKRTVITTVKYKRLSTGLWLTSAGEQISALRLREATISRECVLGHRCLSLSSLTCPRLQIPGPSPEQHNRARTPFFWWDRLYWYSFFSTKEVSQRLPKA